MFRKCPEATAPYYINGDENRCTDVRPLCYWPARSPRRRRHAPWRNRSTNDTLTAKATQTIKDEEQKNSEVMKTLSYLTDVIGPRLTASPNMRCANEWTRDRLASWGASNAHLESWGPFGRGWSLKRFSMQLVEPRCVPLIAFPKAWSDGTDGQVVAETVYFDAADPKDFEKYKGKLKGKIVLVGRPRILTTKFEPIASRLTDTDLLKKADAVGPAPDSAE